MDADQIEFEKNKILQERIFKMTDWQNELLYKQYETRIQFARNLSLLAATLLGIIVALKSDNQTALWLRWALAAAIGLLSLGIGCLQIAVSGLGSLTKQLAAEIHRTVLFLAEQPVEKHKSEILWVPEKKIYRISNQIGCASTASGIALLAVYGVALAFS